MMNARMMRGSLVRAAVLGMLGIGVAWSGQATAAVIHDTANDVALLDTSGDNVGDSVGGTGVNGLIVGEATADANEIRAWMPFTLTAAQRTDIASAGSIKLSLRLNGNDNMTGFKMDIVGLSGRTSDEAVKGDFEAAGTVVHHDVLSDGSATGTRYEFDVTEFVKNEAATAGSVIVFRLQVSPDTLPNTDGKLNKFNFNSHESGNLDTYAPQLITGPAVPEPASLALVGLSVGGLMLRRR